MSERRGLMSVSASGSDVLIETGQFTLTADTKTYTIQHSLGVIPNFCMVYPIDVPQATAAYRIAWQMITRDLGQADYDISTNAVEHVSPRSIWGGVGYALNVAGSNYTGGNSARVNYGGTASETTFVVGALNEQSSAGMLSTGTYGYILGRA